MPVYDFLHASCSTGWEAYVARVGESAPCPKCNTPEGVEKVWGGLGSVHVGASTYPYVTKNLTPDGSPIVVKSERHLRSLCERYGKTHRPDAAWVEKKYEGYDWVNKKQRYSEGSGRGLPGSWI